MFDVNAEKIYCNHCGKEMNRDDKFIFIHYLFRRLINVKDNDPKCYCCVECAKLDEPSLEIFINDMVSKDCYQYMYSPATVFYTNDIELVTEQSRVVTLFKTLDSFINKYNTNKVYIELNATLNKLKERQKQSND